MFNTGWLGSRFGKGHYPNWFSYTGEYNFEEFLSEYKDKPNLNYLQLGVFTGDTSNWLMKNVLTNETSHLTDVDTWLGSAAEEVHSLYDFEDVYQLYLSRMERFYPRVNHKRDNTFNFLNAENNKRNTYDFIYIDADHVASSVLSDAELSWPLLKLGGILAFDDYTWGKELEAKLIPKTAIDLFVNKYKNEIETIAINSQYWIKKI
jgi:predicted O-methyltransferase YrrM